MKALEKKESKYIPASCPNPPNVAAIVSVTSGESASPHVKERKFQPLCDLVGAPPNTLSRSFTDFTAQWSLYSSSLHLDTVPQQGVLIIQPRALGVVGKIEDCRRPNISADLICLSRSNKLSYYSFLVAMILVEKISISIYHHSVGS